MGVKGVHPAWLPPQATPASGQWPFPRQRPSLGPQQETQLSLPQPSGNCPSENLRWSELPTAWDPAPHPVAPERCKARGFAKRGSFPLPTWKTLRTVEDVGNPGTRHLHSQMGLLSSSLITENPGTERTVRRLSVRPGWTTMSMRLVCPRLWAVSPQGGCDELPERRQVEGM